AGHVGERAALAAQGLGFHGGDVAHQLGSLALEHRLEVVELLLVERRLGGELELLDLGAAVLAQGALDDGLGARGDEGFADRALGVEQAAEAGGDRGNGRGAGFGLLGGLGRDDGDAFARGFLSAGGGCWGSLWGLGLVLVGLGLLGLFGLVVLGLSGLGGLGFLVACRATCFAGFLRH